MQSKIKFVRLNYQIAMMFIIVILLVIGFIATMNTSLLGFYYIQEKASAMTDAYQQINQWYNNDNEGSIEFSLSMERLHANNNMAIVILESDGNTIYSTGKDNVSNYSILMDAIMGTNLKGHDKIWFKTDNYTILRMEDDRLAEDYIVLWGTLDDGNLILLRSPLESMKESARISNKFFLIGSIFAIIVSVYATIILTHKITRPILRLTEISESMSKMDFNVKYYPSDEMKKNEIDILGEHMNELSETLEQKIIELKNANHALKHDIVLKEENQHKQKEFIRNVSHELKTPIAVISGYAEGLKDSINDDPESREFYCDVILDEANRMNKMVLELINLNQLEMGSEQLDIQRINIINLIENMLPSYKLLFEQNDIRFEFEYAEEMDIYADEYALEQVINNFLSNAVHYCKGDDKYITLKLERIADHCRLSVFNSGDQIPEESIPYLWDTFYKVDKARTRQYGGTGVGLSIVKAVMEDLNQKYGVENKTNGVEFWIELEC